MVRLAPYPRGDQVSKANDELLSFATLALITEEGAGAMATGIVFMVGIVGALVAAGYLLYWKLPKTIVTGAWSLITCKELIERQAKEKAERQARLRAAGALPPFQQ